MTRLSRRELATRIRGLFYPGTGEEVIGYILDRLRDKSKRRHFVADLTDKAASQKARMKRFWHRRDQELWDEQTTLLIKTVKELR